MSNLLSRLSALEREYGFSRTGDLEYHLLGVGVDELGGVPCSRPEHAGAGCFMSVARGFGYPDGRNRMMVIEGAPGQVNRSAFNPL